MTRRPAAADELGAELGAELRALVADRCRVGWRAIDARDIETLTVGEEAVVERAVELRRAEFATGRALLRSLLAADIEIPKGPSGAPVLPAGFVGSLAHDREVAVGVVASIESVRAVGIDVEVVQDLDERVAELVVRPDDVV